MVVDQVTFVGASSGLRFQGSSAYTVTDVVGQGPSTVIAQAPLGTVARAVFGIGAAPTGGLACSGCGTVAGGLVSTVDLHIDPGPRGRRPARAGHRGRLRRDVPGGVLRPRVPRGARGAP
ncbi:MAG: hypothetical protein H6734_08880 [Alphaproteobacteria bacterium]|nr:hypothetical protein [Alphaproteobacteria bacterium]